MSQKRDSCVNTMVPSMLASPHGDLHAVLPGTCGSLEDTSSASRIISLAVVGPKHLPALLSNERANVRSLIWELCGRPFPTDSSELSQSDVQGPPAVHLAPECHFCPGDHLPADDCQWITHGIYRNYTSLTAHLDDYGKWVVFFFFFHL